MVRAAAVLVMIVAGCGEPVAPPDAALGLHYSLAITSINGYDTFSPPHRDTPPQVFIDGVATRFLTVDYASNADGVASTHHIELRSYNLVIAEVVTNTADLEYCSTQLVQPITSYSEGYCEYESGELRYFGSTASGCASDNFCMPRCAPAYGSDTCGPGLHCSSIVMSTQPLFTHLASVPDGTKQVGEPCALIPDPAGAYDDCSDNSLCVAGTCQAMCLSDAPRACTSCTYIDGEPPELRLCSN